MTKEIARRPVDRLKILLNKPNIQQQFNAALDHYAGPFLTSLVELFVSTKLTECDPNLVVGEAMKAASLNLPISKALGQSYIIPYSGIPEFQIGWKGWVQLAERTNQYRTINAGPVYEGQEVEFDIVKARLRLSGSARNKVITGFFAYFERLNGREHSLFWTKNEMQEYATQYSPSYRGKKKFLSRWSKDFAGMGVKTMVKQILSKWGYVSPEIMKAFDLDSSSYEEQEYIVSDPNEGDIIDIPVETTPEPTPENNRKPKVQGVAKRIEEPEQKGAWPVMDEQNKAPRKSVKEQINTLKENQKKASPEFDDRPLSFDNPGF